MNDNQTGFEKSTMIKVVKVAIFCGLGYWAAGPLGAVIGLLIAMRKTRD